MELTLDSESAIELKACDSFPSRSFPFKEVFLDRSEQEDVPTLIDRKVQPHKLFGIFCQFTAYAPYMQAQSWGHDVNRLFTNSSVLLRYSLQDNVFIISNPKSKYPVLQLDLRYATKCSVFEAINENIFPSCIDC